MKKRNSATAAPTASRWKKISKKRRRKKNPGPRLQKAARRPPSPFRRLHPLSPGPRPPLPVVEAEAANLKPKRKRPRNPPRRKKRRRRSLRKRRQARKPQRKKLRSVPRKRRQKKQGKKAKDAVKSEPGLEPLQLSKPRVSVRGFLFCQNRPAGRRNC